MDIDEQKVVEFLREKDLIVKEFTNEEKTQSKTPDFKIFKGDKLVFFCEVKTIEEDTWLIDQLIKKARSGPIEVQRRNDPRFNRLTDKIHEAVKQFEAVNPNMELPNILIFVNHNERCNSHTLLNVTTGRFFAKGGTQHPVYNKFSKGRIKEEKFRIHLYIWKDEFKGDFYLFKTGEKKHCNNLCSYFGINPNSIKNIYYTR